MKALRRFARRLLASVVEHRDDERVREELTEHLTQLVDEYVRAGVPLDEAQRRAKLKLGVFDATTEAHRDEQRLRWLEDFGADLRHGVRTLRRSPGFATVAILTLALGIGGVTAMFSAFYAILIRPLPYADADRLVVIWDDEPSAQISKQFAAPAEWLVWRRTNTVFTDMAVTQGAAASLSGGAGPEQVPALKATASLWTTLRTTPLIGRTFTESEDEQGAKVVVIGYGLWQRRFGGSPDVLGRSLMVNDDSFEVIGVLPPDFYYLPSPDIQIWMPASFPAWMRTSFGWHNAQVVARLKPGVTMAHARGAMNALSLEVTAKLKPGPHYVLLTPLREEIAGKTRSALVVLLCAAAAVLLIACVNLANLLMSRGAARDREVAVRAALGAGRGRLIAQFLTENLVLAGLGAIAGLVLAIPAMHYLETLGPEAMSTVRLTVDWRVLACCASVARRGHVDLWVGPRAARVESGARRRPA